MSVRAGETASVEEVVDVHTGAFRFRYLSLSTLGLTGLCKAKLIVNNHDWADGPPFNIKVAMTENIGMKELRTKIDELAKFGSGMDGVLARVSFDPHELSSIEAAFQRACTSVDDRAKAYSRNDMVQNLAERAKQSLREQIQERAAAARLKDNEE